MILKQFYDENLAQASYLVGCAASGEALVIDPNRDAAQYIAAAAAEGLRVTAVTETHIHADFVSGTRELAVRTGARMYLSDEGDESWKYRFAKDDGATLVKNGDIIKVGNIRIEVMHTPGHTPEHISFLLTDTAATDRPMGVFTGDFMFVGDVGRPDLLEKAAKLVGTQEAAARTLYRSLRKVQHLPDYLQIWPGHGAGSACGKGLSSVRQSTLGYERITNWAFAPVDEEAFVAAVLSGQPEPPKYFAEMKRINKEGPPILHGFHHPEHHTGSQPAALLKQGDTIVDTRPAAEFAAGHIPGTINIPLNKAFSTWAGWLIPYDASFSLLIDHRCDQCLDEATRDLTTIGLDRINGYFDAEGALAAWIDGGGRLETVPQMTAQDLARLLQADAVTIVDVRGQTEWEAGHLPGAIHIPLGDLTDRLTELPREKPIVVQCGSGARSAIGASLLRANGFENVINLAGGFAAWQATGKPVDRPVCQTG